MKKHVKIKFLALSAVLFISSLSWGQIPNYVPTNGLVGWWPFNGNANDESGNGNNGTVNGATLTADRNGVANSAYYFSSSGCATRIDVNVNTSSIQTGLTMSVWVMNVGNGCIGPRLLEFWPGSNGPGQAQWGTAYGSLNIYGVGSTTSTGFSCAAGIPMSPNNIWSHLVYTNNGNQGKFYKDGVLITTVNSTGNPILASSAAFGRMNHPAYDAYNGNLDDIGIWNRALSDCEVAALYSGQLVNPPTVDLGNDSLSVCGTSTTLDATNTAAGNYLWNTGATSPTLEVTNTGTYFVTVTDTSGCSATDSIYASVIDPTITAQETAFCLGDSTVLSVQSSGNSCGALSGTLQNGLVGWWPFCGNANDESGNGYDGEFVNEVNGLIYSSDRFGNINSSIEFNSLNIGNQLLAPYVNITNSSSVVFDQEYSFSVWSKIGINTQVAELINRGPDNNSFFSRFQGLNGFAFGNYPDYFNNTMIIDTTQWHMYTYIRTNSGNGQLYYDGLLIETQQIAAISNSGNNFAFGKMPSGGTNGSYYPYQGKLDDIGIWNRALTQQEIQDLYNQGNLSTWWSDGTTNQNNIQVQPTQTTTYSVTVSDGVGTCTDSITIQVNNPQVNAGSDLSVCEGETATLTATGADTYAWDNGVVNGQPFTPTVDGYYTVTGTDTLGCSNTVSVFLDVLQPTSSTITPVSCDTYTAPDNEVYTNSGQYTAIIPNAAGCDSTITINLTVNNSNSGTDAKTACDSYTWIDGNTYTSSTNSPTFTLQNVNGCDSVITLNLTINKLQGLNAGDDITACQGDNITLVASGATTYSWTGGAANGVAFVPPTGTTIYTVTGTDDNGCTATDAVSVLVEYCLDIPGGISPNSDNANDTWTITGLDQYPDAKVFVFDRWGQKVFSGDATNATWDGTYEGKELPTADYYYIIELGNGEKFNGVVTLKK
jgi:gliding motility-associated-like protein